MRKSQGGTKMWCPSCETIQVCAAVPLTHLGHESGQRWQRTDHPDIQWFRRGRVCKACGWEFVTAEMNEDRLEELVELRDALSELKANAEQYASESTKASRALEKLAGSLKVLKALRTYKESK